MDWHLHAPDRIDNGAIAQIMELIIATNKAAASHDGAAYRASFLFMQILLRTSTVMMPPGLSSVRLMCRFACTSHQALETPRDGLHVQEVEGDAGGEGGGGGGGGGEFLPD